MKAILRYSIIILLALHVSFIQGNTDQISDNKYNDLKTAVILKQQQIREQYLRCASDEDKSAVLDSTSGYLFKILTENIFPQWYGTRWDFNGVSRTPGQGGIACGSFVVFTLQDAGFNIPSKMYRQPSENIIKNLTDETNIKRFSNHVSMERIIEWIKLKGEGLYIVGLDIHVGFIIYAGRKMTFCHSNYYDPPQHVENQDILDISPLTESNYRVLGKILTKDMIKKWIFGEPFKLKYNYFENE
jgi:hypothetical protein